MDKRALRRFRARTISMVYQEPGRALNPSIRVGRQVAEVYEVGGTKRPEALGPRRGNARHGADRRIPGGCCAPTRTSCRAGCCRES